MTRLPGPGHKVLRDIDTYQKAQQARERAYQSGRTPQAEWDNERVGQFVQQRRGEAQRNGLSPQQFSALQSLPPMPTMTPPPLRG